MYYLSVVMSGSFDEMCRILTAQSLVGRKSFSAIVGRRYSTKFGDVVGCWELGLVRLTVVNGTARRDVVSGIK